jgi:hypothetical protein
MRGRVSRDASIGSKEINSVCSALVGSAEPAGLGDERLPGMASVSTDVLCMMPLLDKKRRGEREKGKRGDKAGASYGD